MLYQILKQLYESALLYLHYKDPSSPFRPLEEHHSFLKDCDFFCNFCSPPGQTSFENDIFNVSDTFYLNKWKLNKSHIWWKEVSFWIKMNWSHSWEKRLTDYMTASHLHLLPSILFWQIPEITLANDHFLAQHWAPVIREHEWLLNI